MFLCEICHAKANESGLLCNCFRYASFGRCEKCHQAYDCYDCHGSYPPKPNLAEVTQDEIVAAMARLLETERELVRGHVPEQDQG